jgi:aminoglycoside phosphotransferase (APT) family kinase protein
MSPANLLDPSTAARIAVLDPALSLLPCALPAAPTRSQWELHDVRWVPGKCCRLAYQVRSPGSPSRFVAVDITTEGWSQQDYREDSSLPGLAAAADPAHVKALLAPLFDEAIGVCRVVPVRYRPGSRCVLRYDVETSRGARKLYAKVFRPERFAEAALIGTLLARPTAGPRLVPELVAVWPDLQVMVGAGIQGRVVSAVVGDSTVPAGQRARLAHRLGDVLATFHGQSHVTATRWSATEQMAALAGSTAAVRAGDAGLADRVDAVLDLLAAGLPPAGAEVLGHGGFRAGQTVLSDDGQLIVLDTDGVCLCDPGRDLGTVLAHLTWQGLRQPEQRATLRGAEHALLAGYESHAGSLEPDALLWWRAVGLLQVAVRRYRRLEVQHWPAAPQLVDAAVEALAALQSHSAPGGATDLLDVRQMSKLLRLALASRAGSSQPVEVDSAVQLATASGRRAVVRYAVRGLDGEEAVRLVGKTFTESRRAQLLFDHLRRLHDGPFRVGDLRVSEPVVLLPEQRLVLYRHCEGTQLDRVTDPAQAEVGVRRAARWLARLHTSDVRLPRRFSLGQEEVSTRRWAALIGHHHPDLAAPAHALAVRWVAAARSADLVDEVPIHKDFHPGHVLVGDGTYVIDLDEARQGDPAFDVAHFCCYLELVRSDSGTAPLNDAFLEEYAAETDWLDKGTFAPFCAYTWLKIAKQWTVGSGPCGEASSAQRVVEAERALAKGDECLSG